MAIKQRVQMKLNTVEDHMLRIMETGDEELLNDVCRELMLTRDFCREGLPKDRYAVYEEFYDGILLAFREMLKNSPQEDALHLCRELLRYVITEIEKERHFKKEVVFLPYKAAMWDSMECIWRAAARDKDHCIPYVIPIPYADRNPDMSVAAWHCERDQFPKDVPVLKWEEIDLKIMHPDIIFFHNPYDNYNLVTSVDKRYYSDYLKKDTDKLVYVPYFVFDEDCCENDVRNFALNQGVVNADRVIVQSETIRKYYINLLVKNTNQTSRDFWEKRILGLGSSKIEKVLHSQREDFEMLSQWRKRIDGRKIVLYITSLTPMLVNTNKVCNKIREVFQIFKSQNNVVLWWRPHPLMKASIHSMRPAIEEEYLQLEKEYIEEGWGIYDNTGDLHRAIAYSDAYYGDGSSVHKLYSRTRKPILIQQYQNVDEIKRDFLQKHKGEDIPSNFGTGLVMEGEPFDLHDLIEAVQHMAYEKVRSESVERPRWNVIWEDESF